MPAAPIYVRMFDAPGVFGASRRTLYRWVEEGGITIYKRGGCAFLKVAEVMAYIEASDAA